jgi:hypothetical protein
MGLAKKSYSVSKNSLLIVLAGPSYSQNLNQRNLSTGARQGINATPEELFHCKYDVN